MYFIPVSIIIISLSGIFYVYFRKIRAVERTREGGLVYPDFAPRSDKEEADRRGVVPFPVTGILEKVLKIRGGDTFFVFAEKFFRRLKVYLMKLENWLTILTNKVHGRAAREREKIIQDRVPSQAPDAPAMGGDEGKRGPKNGSSGGGNVSGAEGAGTGKTSLSGLMEENPDFDEQYWIDVLKQDPASSYPYKKLGKIYIARGDFREARSVFKFALKLDPQDSEVKNKLEELRGKKTKKK